ncbi:MAG TPA: hypothetical protein VJS64_04780 [Pyrinomonadaceae bacterium]|nr:hypothetical protein [Pyrinomonadaceae bacterium]
MSKVMIQRSLPDRTDSRATNESSVWISNDDSAVASRKRESTRELDVEVEQGPLTPPLAATIETPLTKDKNSKHRFGLPAGFVSRLNRYGRTILFQDNVYRLPNGIEFIPQPPAGTLGSRNHQYALLTPEQYEKRQRGSIYVRTDGRIFDYAFWHNAPERELFDTGFTIQDLERTGRYAPLLKAGMPRLRKRKKARKNGRKTRTKRGK